MCNQMFLYFNICYYLWEVMHNATFENTFNIPAKENPLKKNISGFNECRNGLFLTVIILKIIPGY